MSDLVGNAESPALGQVETVAKRPWRAPEIIVSRAQTDTANKSSDTLGEGKLPTTTLIS